MLSNKVREIMTTELTTAPVTETISVVMEKMGAKDIGRIIITDKEVPVGIFTERDVLRRVIHKKLDPKKTSVREVMTSPVRTVPEQTHIVEALGKMYEGRFRHLLVRGRKGNIVGIVSMRRILKIAVELGQGLAETQTIGTIISRKVVTADASKSVEETLNAMVRERSGSVVVSSQGKPQGIFTERDVLRRVAMKEIDTRKTPISEVTTSALITMPHTALVGEVLAEMYRRDFRHMPICGANGELIGIVAMQDVLKYAKALDIDESVRRAWKEVEEFWNADDHYTPG